MNKSIEQQTENSILDMAMDYLDAPELHLSGDDQAGERSTDGTFTIIDRHIPALKSGEYDITVHQTIKGIGISENNTFSTTQTIKVVGTPYQLQPAEVFSIYPPNASTGDFSDTLPHIVLHRSTIPWERPALNGDENTPWLALVVLNEAEIDITKSIKAGETIRFDSNLINAENLVDLAHVVRRLDESEQAVVIANRLLTTGSSNVIHLVAVDKDNFPNNNLPAGQQEFISLFNWQVNCVNSDKKPLDNTIINLKGGLLRLPPTKNNQTFNEYFAKGFVPLPHFLRRGSRTVSWYRSPLVPKTCIKGVRFRNANHSDSLLRYDSTTKMLDTTYAAAWELGRLLTLQEKDIAQAIYIWKRGIAQQNKQDSEDELAALLNDEETAIKLPDNIKGWMNNLLFLKQVPFNYLVPYEQMLPSESIRFFMLDMKWVQSLLDGAMSVGRIFDKKENSPKKVEESKLSWSGLIIRSNVIADYPDLNIQSGTAQPVYTRRLGNDILLCMFQNQTITEVDFVIKSDALHFGFSKTDNGFSKRLRTIDGRLTDKTVEVSVDNNGLIDLQGLKNSIEEASSFTVTSATLAIQLMEINASVKFKSTN